MNIFFAPGYQLRLILRRAQVSQQAAGLVPQNLNGAGNAPGLLFFQRHLRPDGAAEVKLAAIFDRLARN